jgi:hypothetical protein
VKTFGVFRWIFSDTEEIAELLVMLIGVFTGVSQNRGGDVLRDEIKAFEHVEDSYWKKPILKRRRLLL